VKFAKYIATPEDNATVLPQAVRFVTSTYQTQVEEEAETAGEAGGDEEAPKPAAHVEKDEDYMPK